MSTVIKHSSDDQQGTFVKRSGISESGSSDFAWNENRTVPVLNSREDQEFCYVQVFGVEQSDSKSGNSHKNKTANPRRRLTGIFREFIDHEFARVILFDGSQKCEYQWPAEVFRAANIKSRNQPFQIDEVVSRDGWSYSIMPLAESSAVFSEYQKETEERTARRARIAQAFE